MQTVELTKTRLGNFLLERFHQEPLGKVHNILKPILQGVEHGVFSLSQPDGMGIPKILNAFAGLTSGRSSSLKYVEFFSLSHPLNRSGWMTEQAYHRAVAAALQESRGTEFSSSLNLRYRTHLQERYRNIWNEVDEIIRTDTTGFAGQLFKTVTATLQKGIGNDELWMLLRNILIETVYLNITDLLSYYLTYGAVEDPFAERFENLVELLPRYIPFAQMKDDSSRLMVIVQ